MHRFGYHELELGIPPDITALAMEVSALQSRISTLMEGHGHEYAELAREATVSSVKHSNLIESISIPDDRLEALMSRSDTPRSEAECEVAGYRDALDEVLTGKYLLEPGADDIERLHGILMSYTGWKGGSYKERDNAIIGRYADGSTRVIFEPVPASQTPAAMESLLETYELYCADGGIPNLLLIPCFILDFLCIHPFTDGNGRMSRLLTTSLLLENGYDACLYSSVDKRIFEDRGGYYRMLAMSSRGWMENGFSYFPFVRHFLEMLFGSGSRLLNRIDARRPQHRQNVRPPRSTMRTDPGPRGLIRKNVISIT